MIPEEVLENVETFELSSKKAPKVIEFQRKGTEYAYSSQRSFHPH
jgi:hypothetical protein